MRSFTGLKSDLNAANEYISTNLFVQQNLTRDEGHYYSPSSGYIAREGYSCYLAEVIPNRTYYTIAASYVLYDESMNKISSGDVSGSVPKSFTTTSATKYVAINYNGLPSFIQTGTDGYWLSLINEPQTLRVKTKDERLNNIGTLYHTNLILQQNLVREIGHYYSPSAGFYAREGSSCYLVEVEPNTTYYTTCSAYVMYDANMTKISNADLNLALVRPITTTPSTKYIALNYLGDLAYFQEGTEDTDGYWISKVNGPQHWEFTANDSRIDKLEYLQSEITRNNRRIIDPGIVFDCNALTNNGHCTVLDSSVTKFSKISKRVICQNTGSSQSVKLPLNTPVLRSELRSISIVFYVPQGAAQTDMLGSGRFSLSLGGIRGTTVDYIKPLNNTHSNARCVYGWNVLKFGIDDVTSDITVLPEVINTVYIDFSPRSSVPTDGKYGGYIFDSIIFNQKMRPTLLLNFDQWWNESENNDGYTIAENRNIPYTVFTAEESLTSAKKTKAMYRENVFGCENAIYGGYVSSATNIQYSDAKTKYETQQEAFTQNYLRTNVSYGCKHNWYHPIHIAALRDSGVQLIRTWSSGIPTGYIDKDIYYLSTISISNLTLNELKHLVDRAIDEGSVLPLFTHGICANNATYMTNDDGTLSASDGIQVGIYTDFLNYVKTKVDAGLIDCMTFKDFYMDCVK